MEPIKLRAHHLEGFFEIRKLDRETLARVLVEQGYVPDTNHPFVDHVYGISQQLKQPNQQIRVVIGQPDIVCNYPCPKKSDCSHVYPEKSKLAGSVFGQRAASDLDERVAEICNVMPNHIYKSNYAFFWFKCNLR